MENKNKLALITAFNKGYRTNGINVISHKGTMLTLIKSKENRLYFTVKFEKQSRSISVHRLMAFQKYGYDMFKEGIEVRHKNGNSLDNSEENILIGTHLENMRDVPEEIKRRKEIQIYATSFIKKYNHIQILNMHNEGMSYSEIMNKTGIKSKGTISFIINKSIAYMSK